jgi:hypothetical protein
VIHTNKDKIENERRNEERKRRRDLREERARIRISSVPHLGERRSGEQIIFILYLQKGERRSGEESRQFPTWASAEVGK